MNNTDRIGAFVTTANPKSLESIADDSRRGIARLQSESDIHVWKDVYNAYFNKDLDAIRKEYRQDINQRFIDEFEFSKSTARYLSSWAPLPLNNPRSKRFAAYIFAFLAGGTYTRPLTAAAIMLGLDIDDMMKGTIYTEYIKAPTSGLWSLFGSQILNMKQHMQSHMPTRNELYFAAGITAAKIMESGIRHYLYNAHNKYLPSYMMNFGNFCGDLWSAIPANIFLIDDIKYKMRHKTITTPESQHTS